MFSDQGLGVHVVRNLMQQGLPDHVECIEEGASGLNLIPWMDERDKVIFVSALPTGSDPGTVRRMSILELKALLEARPKSGVKPTEGACMTESRAEPEDDHPSDGEVLMETINMARYLGITPEVIVISVEPADTKPGTDLSNVLQELIPAVMAAVRQEIPMDT